MDAALRIMDANANRAREGLRVMEDIARFALDRADLSAAAKQIRHDLAESVARASGNAIARLASRDVEHDVGTSISTTGEFLRQGWHDLVLSASGRTSEALRSLEEVAKLLGHPSAAAQIEQCRYRTYALEKNLVLSLPSGRTRQWRLCVLLTESLCTHHTWKAVAVEAIAGGADCIQLREKALPDSELLKRAKELVQLCRASATGVSVVVNDRPDIAKLAKADGVHLGQEDLPVHEARELLGPEATIGVSTSRLEEARAAIRHGADYIGVGPMFPTSTKVKESIVGPAYLSAVIADPTLAQTRHLAIGGITPERVSQIPGVRGIAVSSAVCSASDPKDACQRLIQAFNSPR